MFQDSVPPSILVRMTERLDLLVTARDLRKAGHIVRAESVEREAIEHLTKTQEMVATYKSMGLMPEGVSV